MNELKLGKTNKNAVLYKISECLRYDPIWWDHANDHTTNATSRSNIRQYSPVAEQTFKVETGHYPQLLSKDLRINVSCINQCVAHIIRTTESKGFSYIQFALVT